MSTSTKLPPVSSAIPPQVATPTTFATAPSLVARGEAALITPHVYPQECENVFNFTTKSSSWESYGMRREGFLYVDMEWQRPGQYNYNARWQKCQPPGRTWGYAEERDRALYSDRMSVYRGTVCPSGWHAYEMGMTTTLLGTCGDTYGKDEWQLLYERYPNYSQASVCISIREPTSDYHGYGSPRVTYTDQSVYTATIGTYISIISTFTEIETYEGLSTTTRTFIDAGMSSYVTTATFNSGRVFYPAWSIEWVEEDNATLKPPWPTLTNNMLVATYSGQTLPTNGRYDNGGEGRPTFTPQPPSTPNKVVIPVVTILGFLMLLGAGMALSLWRKKRVEMKREKKMKEEKRWRLEQGGEEPLEMGDMSEMGSTAVFDTWPETEHSLPVEGETEVVRTEAASVTERPGRTN